MSSKDPRINRDAASSGLEPQFEHRPRSLDAYNGDAGPLPSVPGRVRPSLLWIGDGPDLMQWSAIAVQSGYESASSGFDDLCPVAQALMPDLILMPSASVPGILIDAAGWVRTHSDLLVRRLRMVVITPSMASEPMKRLFGIGIDDIVLTSDWGAILRACARAIRYGVAPAPLTALTNPSPLVRHEAMRHIVRSMGEPDPCAGLRALVQYPDPAVQAGVRAVQLGLRCEE